MVYEVEFFLTPFFFSNPNLTLELFTLIVSYRSAGWPWQSCELSWGHRWWHGCVYRFLGQLPEDLELTTQLTYSTHYSLIMHTVCTLMYICLHRHTCLTKNCTYYI